jgi:hypothetical protein
MSAMRVTAVGISAFCAAGLACAGGSYHPGKIDLAFTPIPFTALPDGTPVSVSSECDVFPAGEVVVLLEAKERQAFDDWLERIGFDVRREFATGPSDSLRTYLVGVPLGSVPDAASLIATRPGVRSAGPNGYGHLPDDPPFGERFFGCKAPG